MSTASIANTGIRTAQSAMTKTANNIANSNTDGFKRGLSENMNLMSERGVYSLDGNAIDIKGSIENTGIVTDLATSNSKSFFIVRDKGNGEAVNVVTGSFRLNNQKQLEYLDKYLLLGSKYNADETVTSNDLEALTPIEIDSDQLSDAVATKKVKQSFNLNSQLLPKGQTSFLMTPDASIRSINTPSLNDPLKSGGALKVGNGFEINIEEEKDGTISSSYVKCIFSGDIKSQGFANNQNGLLSSTGSLDISWNNVKASIDIPSIVSTTPSATNNLDILQAIERQLTALKLDVKVVTDPSTNTSFLQIMPPRKDGDSFSMSGALAGTLGVNTSVSPSTSDTIRFSSMSDLRDKLSEKFSSIEANAKSDSLLFISKPNSKVAMSNLDPSQDVLSLLGMRSANRYDPYDNKSNMASRNATPDVVRSVALYDSLGTPHIANLALKKVEDGWIQELYFANPKEIQGGREDGLLQVTKFKFGPQGKFSEAEGIAPPVTTEGLTDPFAAIGVLGQTLLSVNGQNFSAKSLVDLANEINKDPKTNIAVEATVFKNSQGLYQLKILSKTGNKPVVAGGVLKTNDFDALPGASTELTVNLKKNVNPIQISFDFEHMKESAYSQMFGEVEADGSAPSTISGISIASNGDLIGKFANGSSKKLYKIPLATYTNVNGLEVMGDNALRGNAKSGQIRILNPGEGSAGEILSGNKESSNVNIEQELTDLVQNKQFYNMNVKAWQTGNGIIDYLLNAANF